MRPRAALLVGAITLGIVLFTGIIGTVVVYVAIWPGEARLVDGLICPDTHPDLVVVRQNVTTTDGTGTTDRNVCLDDRGDAVNEGQGGAFLILAAAHTAILLVLTGLIGWFPLRRLATRLTSDRSRTRHRTATKGARPPGRRASGRSLRCRAPSPPAG